ncbi:MAG: ABC transporter permease [Rhodothermales bacterium]|nr:ABC transporter permease [Rhodothermales bacterium]
MTKSRSYGKLTAVVWLTAMLVASCVGERQPSSDLSLANVPPSSRLLQTWLGADHTKRAHAEVSSGGLFGSRGGSSCSADALETIPSAPALRIPNRVAVEGRVYQAVLAEADQDACLVEGPPGMTLQAGVLRWPGQQVSRGRHMVRVLARRGPQPELLAFTLVGADRNYLLGTDRLGRSVLSIVRIGGFWAMSYAALFTLVAMVLGVLGGSVAGYFERTGRVFDWFSNAVESVPILVAFFVVAVISGFQLIWIAVMGGVVMAPRVAAATRQLVAELASRDWVEAARELGESPFAIVASDIVRFNLVRQITAASLGVFSFAVVLEVTLSYLRIGIQAPDVSWGTLLLDSRERIPSGEFWGFAAAISVVLATVGALNYLARTTETEG